MKALTDTNALLWIACAPDRLTESAERAIADSDEVWFSIVNIWEIGLKLSKGGFHDLDVAPDWDRKLVPRLLEEGFRLMPVQVAHCRRVQDLPFHHKDPFDRMLVAQALEEGLDVISSDGQFDAYGVRRIW
ncbi:MAG: type II toxin-antitoxin system VapC family toxin [Verrucomicrobiales bacterium]